MLAFRLSASLEHEMPPFLPTVHLGQMMQFISNETQLVGDIFLYSRKEKDMVIVLQNPSSLHLGFSDCAPVSQMSLLPN